MRFFKFADIVTWRAIYSIDLKFVLSSIEYIYSTMTWDIFDSLKIDDLALKKRPFYRQENILFFITTPFC